MSNLTTNIASHLAAMARQQPSRPAVICPHRPDARGRDRYTFQELDEISDALAHGFHALGVRRGTRTALMVPPSLEFFALTFALFKTGAVPVLIDPGIGVAGLGKGLAEAEPEAFIGIPKAQLARLLFGWGRASVRLKITAGPFALTGGHTLEKVRRLGVGQGPFAAVTPDPGELAAILFTSGSTGPSKGVVYTHGYFARQVELIRQLYKIEPGEIDLPTFPLFALFGPALGMTEVLPDMDPTRPAEVDPRKIISAIERFSVTNMFGSPALINRVGRHGAAEGIKLTTLRRVISAGAPVPAKVIERFVTLLPPGAQVFTPYGATECLPVASIGSAELLDETRFQTDLGKGVCVGKPVPGLTVKIIRITDEPIAEWTDSLELSPGQIGEIAVKGSHVTGTYHRRPEATALAKISDPAGGFYHRMGDVGCVDDQGRIWFCGRKAHRVVTARETLFTIPCEAVFNTHPAVFRTALVGVRRGGEMEPVLCGELEHGKSHDQSHVRNELLAIAEKFPHTRSIKTIMFHPAFPVDIRHNAKIFREQLASWAEGQLQ